MLGMRALFDKTWFVHGTGGVEAWGSPHDDRRAGGRVAKLLRLRAGEDAAALTVDDRLVDYSRPEPTRMGVKDRPDRGHDRDALVRGDLVVAQVGTVHDVERGRLALRTVGSRDGDVDLDGFTSLSSYRLSAVSLLSTPRTPRGHSVASLY